ncbi:uncharacterized protein LOC134820877 isoform X2 [Bolinopsis microptera]|uniref:uncharacterized protein LOC134820877 isoform X2 n=1 Tax=Bolinopsis microptera TaxID=2820187 RepID=UPI003079DBF4
MAFLKLMVFSAVAIVLASSKKGGSAVSVEELRELLVSSMQTTISLTAVVEQQTKSISEITNFVDEAKEEIKDLKSKIESLGQKDEEQTGIEELEEKLVKEIEALKETCAEELKARKNDVMVVSGEENLREERCAKVCAGTSVRGATNWVDYSSNGIYADVDISKCGFVTIPTVTSSLEGTTSHWTTTGSSEIYSVTTGTFRIYLVAQSGRGGGANKMGWNVEWIAVGYTC